MIENCSRSEVKEWNYEEGNGAIHTYIWLKDHDYVVILKNYKDGQLRLKTAYYIDFPHKRRKLEKKYNNRI